jgi:hypothetical protein
MALGACAAALLCGSAWATDFPETEPNDTKGAANGVTPMVAGDRITGNTTGSSTITPGAASADYFRVQTGPLPPAIYRHRLVITTDGTAGHTGTIRGLTQTAGVPNAGTDATVQTSSTTTSPPRFVQWYGFGRGEEIYCRVTGTSSTTADYAATLESETIAAEVISGSFVGPQIEITTISQGHSTDTELWLYDANLNAIADAGNDDAFQFAGLQSRLVRDLAPGTYYLAISNFNMCNNLGSPPDDDFRSGAVLDFPDAIANSSTTANLNVTFSIVDSNGPAQVPATKSEPFQVLWFQFTVISPPPFGACCLPSGACLSDISSADCTNQGGTYRGDGSDCARANCTGACCLADGSCVETGPSACADQGGDYRGDGTTCANTVCTGACCFPNGTCQDLGPAPCASANGSFQGVGTDCSPNPCPQPPLGACCVGTDCSIDDPFDCAARGGSYQGDNTNCGQFSYAEANCESAFEDISGSGTQSSAGNCDDCGEIVSIGFSFVFYGVAYTEVGISSNGYLTFNATPLGDFTNDPIPTAATPNNIVCPLWDDLNPLTRGDVQYQTLANPDRFIVQWTDVPQFAQSDSNTFQVVLFANGDVEFRYLNITPQATSGDYTVGVEDATGTIGTAIDAAALGGGNTCRRLNAEATDPPCATPCAGHLRGDSDGTGAVNNFDIDAFVMALSNPDAYIALFCNGDTECYICRNDLNGNGAVNNFDIDAFVACLNSLPAPGEACP